MARLNEPPVSSDSIETLRKKFLRQNRDLAKSNNIRALRIRELENECACLLSENLELRGRILELEKQAEDNDARRIADHALAIKARLESQLIEWGTLLAGLGLEPPAKRHSPRARKSATHRLSFSASRPSPSQRRLRDIARDIEELGHIPESKSYPRKSMNHEQILALRSELDTSDMTDSPELGPPPKSQFIDHDSVTGDSPTKAPVAMAHGESPKRAVGPSLLLPSAKADEAVAPPSPSPEAKKEPRATPQILAHIDEPTAHRPVKAGSKRKFAAWGDGEMEPSQRNNDENQPISMLPQESTRDKANGKAPKELAGARKESRGKQGASSSAREPLAAKSTNNDLGSPKKVSKSATTDEVAAAKADLARAKASRERSRPRAKGVAPARTEAVPCPDLPPPTTAELTAPVTEPVLLSPHSPAPEPAGSGPRGDTPPPLDISFKGETSRPSRRSRAAVSYAEPNLRDKMRRPTKELFDAVAGEGKYARRSSQAGPLDRVKRESDASESWKTMPTPRAPAQPGDPEPEATPASPLASKSSSPQELPDSVATERRRRPPSAAHKASHDGGGGDGSLDTGSLDAGADAGGNADTSASSSVDIYEFTSSSPQVDREEEAIEARRPSRRQTTSTRRLSTTAEGDNGRASTRRRSMAL